MFLTAFRLFFLDQICLNVDFHVFPCFLVSFLPYFFVPAILKYSVYSLAISYHLPCRLMFGIQQPLYSLWFPVVFFFFFFSSHKDFYSFLYAFLKHSGFFLGKLRFMLSGNSSVWAFQLISVIYLQTLSQICIYRL